MGWSWADLMVTPDGVVKAAFDFMVDTLEHESDEAARRQLALRALQKAKKRRR